MSTTRFGSPFVTSRRARGLVSLHDGGAQRPGPVSRTVFIRACWFALASLLTCTLLGPLGLVGCGPSSSGSPGGGSPPPASCGPSFGSTCDSCIQQACCSEWAACGSSPGCTTLERCLVGCGANPTCAAACAGGSDAGTNGVYDTAAACMDRRCASECSGALGSVASASGPASSGCTYSRCPASVTCAAPGGATGTYSLQCLEANIQTSGQRPPIACYVGGDAGTPVTPAFASGDTCTAAPIVCAWPGGTILCPAFYLVPNLMGGVSPLGGCCGLMSGLSTTPSCGVIGAPLGREPGPFVCTAVQAEDTPE